MPSHFGVYKQTFLASGFFWVNLQGFKRGSVGTGGILPSPYLQRLRKSIWKWGFGGAPLLIITGRAIIRSGWLELCHKTPKFREHTFKGGKLTATKKRIPYIRQCNILSFSANFHTSSLVTRLLAPLDSEAMGLDRGRWCLKAKVKHRDFSDPLYPESLTFCLLLPLASSTAWHTVDWSCQNRWSYL